MTSKSKYKDIRVRIVTRRDKGREATAEEIALVVANRGEKYDNKLTVEDIIDAYTRGEEVSGQHLSPGLVWVLNRPKYYSSCLCGAWSVWTSTKLS